MKQTMISSILAVFMITLLSSMVVACSCVPAKSPSEEFASHDAVFIGNVTEVRNNALSNSVSVRFNVTDSYKGATSDEITIETSDSSAACGYNFEEGKSYVVYASMMDGKLHVSLCSRTAQVSDASEDLAYFATLDDNLPGYGNSTNSSGNSTGSSNTGDEVVPSFWGKVANFFRNLFN